MKKKLLPLFTLLVFSVTSGSMAQSFSAPRNYTLEKDDDYKKYEKDVIDCVNWLENTPVAQQQERRKEVGAFLVKWTAGSPDVSITLSSEVTPFIKDPDLLLMYMGGCARYALTHKGDTSAARTTVAGIKSAIKLYKANSMKKNSDVEKLAALDEKGELETWVAKQLKS